MKKLFISSLVFTLGLAACGQDQTEEDTTNGEAADQETNEVDEPRILTDGLGNEVEIPANPESILASYLEDYLVALDITPVAQWSINDGASVQDYLQDELSDVPYIPYDLPFESVMEYEPDLMIVRDPIEQEMHDQYSEITPTYVLNSSPTNWRETLLEIGNVLGVEEDAQTVLDNYDATTQEQASLLEEEIAGESAAAIWMVDTSLFIVHEERSSGAVLYGDLGLDVPAVVSELSGDADWAAISLEEVAQMDVDHLFLVNSDGTEAELFEDRLWQNIPAVQNGNVYEYGPETAWLYNGPVAHEHILNYVVESILE